MELTLADIFKYYNLLSQLDGYTDSVIIENKPKLITRFYSFTVKAKWYIVLNLKNLKDQITPFEKVKENYSNEIKAFLQIGPSEEEQKKKNDEIQLSLTNLLNEKRSVEIIKIPVNDLKLEANNIPGTLLEALFDLLEGQPTFDK